MARALWKGAIVFGLVHIPVDLYPGAKESTLDFDWIDKRDMAPVGYQRINKVTGKPVDMADIVKGYEWEKGNYVVLKDEDFKAANPKATQTVEIVAFVDGDAISPQFFDKPYRLAPGKRGEKGYALLRETLRRSGKVGVAQVVIRNRQHLSVLMPIGDLLELITVRYASDVLGEKDFDLPSLKAAGVSDKEVKLAERLVEDMTEEWKPERYHDTYRDDLMKRIETLATKGRTRAVKAPREEEGEDAKVIDLMAALRRSLESKKTGGPSRTDKTSRAERRAPVAKTRTRRATTAAARKRA
jgi:DNA end-binding protein Ku